MLPPRDHVSSLLKELHWLSLHILHAVQADSADVQSIRCAVSSIRQRHRDADQSEHLSVQSVLCQHHRLHCSMNEDKVWREHSVLWD